MTALLLTLAVPSLAAACAGRDMLAELAAADPDAHAALLARGAAIPNGEGRLWRVEGPDGGVSHLFGTYHDTETYATLTPTVTDTLAGARRFVAELTEAEIGEMEARIAADPLFSLQLEQAVDVRSLADRLTPEERRVAADALARRGMTLEIAAMLKPWVLFSALGVPACQLEAMTTGAPVLDRQLMAEAAARGVPVSGLEDFDVALGAFDLIDANTALALIRDSLALAPREEDVRATMVALYAEGRIGVLQAFAEDLGTRYSPRDPAEVARDNARFAEALIVRRNEAWMARLLPALEGGGAFVAVGALHLPDEMGLVALLRGAGFTVTAVPEG
ncbi:MAG: TraB/GumN family protein [Pseudomonadota bacterium]